MSEKKQEENEVEKKSTETVTEKTQTEKEIEKKPEETVTEKTQTEKEIEKKPEETVTEKTQTENGDIELKTRPEQWILRSCNWYHGEFKDCKSIRARFNQYFVYGEYLDCSQWQTDYENCKNWQSKDDDESYNALLASEKKRRLERLKPHYSNDVWTKRDKPPEGWDKPLPEWLDKQQQHTFLEYKQKSLEDGTVNDIDMKIPFCTIM